MSGVQDDESYVEQQSSTRGYLLKKKKSMDRKALLVKINEDLERNILQRKNEQLLDGMLTSERRESRNHFQSYDQEQQTKEELEQKLSYQGDTYDDQEELQKARVMFRKLNKQLRLRREHEERINNLKDKGFNSSQENKYFQALKAPALTLQDIMGRFEQDKFGNYIIIKGGSDSLYDADQRRVNQRGYLVDRDGNIVDRRGRVMVQRKSLDKHHDIPMKVFKRLFMPNMGSDRSSISSGGGSKRGKRIDTQKLNETSDQNSEGGSDVERRLSTLEEYTYKQQYMHSMEEGRRSNLLDDKSTNLAGASLKINEHDSERMGQILQGSYFMKRGRRSTEEGRTFRLGSGLKMKVSMGLEPKTPSTIVVTKKPKSNASQLCVQDSSLSDEGDIKHHIVKGERTLTESNEFQRISSKKKAVKGKKNLKRKGGSVKSIKSSQPTMKKSSAPSSHKKIQSLTTEQIKSSMMHRSKRINSSSASRRTQPIFEKLPKVLKKSKLKGSSHSVIKYQSNDDDYNSSTIDRATKFRVPQPKSKRINKMDSSSYSTENQFRQTSALWHLDRDRSPPDANQSQQSTQKNHQQAPRSSHVQFEPTFNFVQKKPKVPSQVNKTKKKLKSKQQIDQRGQREQRGQDEYREQRQQKKQKKQNIEEAWRDQEAQSKVRIEKEFRRLKDPCPFNLIDLQQNNKKRKQTDYQQKASEIEKRLFDLGDHYNFSSVQPEQQMASNHMLSLKKQNFKNDFDLPKNYIGRGFNATIRPSDNQDKYIVVKSPYELSTPNIMSKTTLNEYQNNSLQVSGKMMLTPSLNQQQPTSTQMTTPQQQQEFMSKLKRDFYHPSIISPTMSSSTGFNQPSIEAVQIKQNLTKLTTKREPPLNRLMSNQALIRGNIQRDDGKLEELSKIYTHDKYRAKSRTKDKTLESGEEKFRFLHHQSFANTPQLFLVDRYENDSTPTSVLNNIFKS